MANQKLQLLAATITLSLIPWGALANPGSSTPPSNPQFGEGHPAGLANLPPGRLRSQIEKLPSAAQQQALSWLQRFSFPTEDLEFLNVDSEGGVFYGDTLLQQEPQQATESDPSATSTQGMTSAEVFSLHSRPGAANVVFLDFDGHVIQDSAWNNGSTTPLYAQAFDLDGDPNSFSEQERDRIAETWHRIAEDFAPFDIDVTTQDPVNFGPTVGRILITRDEDASGAAMPSKGAGGVAYVGVWGASYYEYYSPALVYYDNLGSGYPAYMAEASSHELGHNLALSHDGSSTVGYYTGHGSGYVSWAPIMGVGYYTNVTQWSKGEYPGANNTQDDLAIISARLSYQFDDHGNSDSSATSLTIAADGSITSSNPEVDPGNIQTENKGIIERNTDTDFFSFDAGAGPLDISVRPAWAAYYRETLRGSNLDLQLALYDAQNLTTPLALSDLLSDTQAQIQTTVSGGSYYLAVTGVGNTVSPYSDYASLGQYFISGMVVPFTEEPSNNPPVANNDVISTNEDTQTSISVLLNDTDADGDILSILAVSSANNGAVIINGSQLQYTPSSNFNGSDTLSYTVSDNNGGNAQATVNISVNAVNDAPVAYSDSAGLDQDNSVVINVLVNDSDIDDTNSTLWVSAVSSASHGQLQISADQRSVSYTPSANYAGSDTFSYTVSDAAGATSTATVSITVLATTSTPVAPSALSAANGQNGTALVSWLDNSANEDNFQIERQKLHKNGSWVGSTLLSTSANVTSLIDSSGNGSFRYRVKSINGSGESNWSSWSTIVDVTGATKGGGGKKGGGKGGGKK